MFKPIRMFSVFLALSLALVPLVNSFASSNMMHNGSCADCEQVLMVIEQTCQQDDCMDNSCSVSTSTLNAIQASTLFLSEFTLSEIQPDSLKTLYYSCFIDHLIRPPIV